MSRFSSSPVLPALAKLIAMASLAGALAAGMLLPFVGGIGLAADKAASSFLDTSCDLTVSPAAQTSTVYASDGTTVIATLYAQNRQDVVLSKIPKSVQAALIATEDRRFYSHHGVDLHGLLRAAAADAGGSGGDTQGGSTLTMQYVKQVRYYQAATTAAREAAVDQNLNRKIKDAKCAVDLEKRYTKDQILDGYFNIAFFGENSYGIQVAAQTYFGVPAAELTVPQGATLVGLLQSPSALDPFVNPQSARDRRNVVLQNMVDNGALSAADAAKYQASSLKLASSKPPQVKQGCLASKTTIKNAGFFCDYVLDWLQETGGLSKQAVETGGLKIVTTLDAALQNSGQQAIWDSGLDPDSATVLVMPSVDPKTGGVTSMITSRHYGVNTGESTVPLFTSAYAGAGSTYKYFTALTALKLGVQPDFTLNTGNSYTVKNCPVDPNSTTVPYTVANAGSYRSTLPLRDALPESVNTYFVGMEDQLFGCDLTPIVQTALGLGMTALNSKTSSGGTIAQDTIDQHQTGFTLGFAPTSALQLSNAYAAMANDGVYCPANPIVSVTNGSGTAVKYKKPSCSRQFEPQVARTMLKMMTADTNSYQGTAASYFRNWYAAGGSPVASKTGTDNDRDDEGNSALWFAGVTPNLVSAAALVNPQDPKATVSGLPDSVSNNGSDVFGAYASSFWLDAYGPTLQSQSWSWPDAGDVDSPVTVPNLYGKSPSDAAAALTAVGLTGSVSSVACGSGEPAGTVGYFGPQVVSAGGKVTLCLSTGTTPVGSYTPYYNPYTSYPNPSASNSDPGSNSDSNPGSSPSYPSNSSPSASGSAAPSLPSAPSSPGSGSSSSGASPNPSPRGTR